mgnify:CR=1 FL=1
MHATRVSLSQLMASRDAVPCRYVLRRAPRCRSHPIAVASQGLKEACDGKGSLAEALEALATSLKVCV